MRASIRNKEGRSAFLPALIWGGAIAVLSLAPKRSFETFDWSNLASMDKVGHLVAYALFAYLLALAFNRGKPALQGRKLWLLSALIAVSYGLFMESLQYGLSSGRRFEILDIIANIIGSLIGLWIYKITH